MYLQALAIATCLLIPFAAADPNHYGGAGQEGPAPEEVDGPCPIIVVKQPGTIPPAQVEPDCVEAWVEHLLEPGPSP